MSESNRSGATHVLFSVFLGLMVATFVGVGVYTFHPPPQGSISTEIEQIDRQEQRIRDSRPPDQLSEADRDQIQALNEERNTLNDAARVVANAWGRSTSIILIIFATLVMVLSLLRAERLPVISNGLLLGGVFSMIYGVGWIVFSDTSITRFVVTAVALLITLGLGYARFVRQASAATPVPALGATGEGVADIERRVIALEKRMNDAANALGGESES